MYEREEDRVKKDRYKQSINHTGGDSKREREKERKTSKIQRKLNILCFSSKKQ